MRCSFPTCDAITVGPSDEGDDEVTNVGMAAHIVAASPGGPRFDPQFTVEQLTSINNGIWMCYTHGKLVDDDVVRFTVPVLRRWKKSAELRARLTIELKRQVEFDDRELAALGLAEHTIGIQCVGDENTLIGNQLLDCCVGQVWGFDAMHVVRDVLIEITRNAFIHGGASHASVTVELCRIVLKDNGAMFDPRDLDAAEHNGGGAASIRHLVEKFADRAIVQYSRVEEENQLVVSFPGSISELVSLTTCVLVLRGADIRSASRGFEFFKSCETLYVVPPDFPTISDAVMLGTFLGAWANLGRDIVIVTEHISGLVQSFMIDRIPNCKVLVLRKTV